MGLYVKTPIVLAFFFYLFVVLLIGIIAYKKTKDISDYILGGRRLGALVAALSAGASDMSGWLLLGLPGLVYKEGLRGLWLVLGLLIGIYLNWKLVAERLRLFSIKFGNSITIPEYLENRFSDSSGILRCISALFILFFFTIYTSSGLVAGGKLFSSIFGLPYFYSMLFGALAIVSYTFLGGFLAVSWTDAFQAMLMLMALLIVPIFAYKSIGGNYELGVCANFFNPFLDESGNNYTILSIISLMAWGLGYFGQPHILARFMATKSTHDIKKATVIGVSWSFLAMSGAVLAGIAGAFYFKHTLQDAERVFILLVQSLFPQLIAGVCLAGILAAIMSTADSQLLVSASALTEDFYRAILRPNANQKELVIMGRATVLLISLVAIFLAKDPNSKVLDMVAYAWAGFGAGFGPVILLSLFWQRMNKAGAIAGILTGSFMVIIWRNLSGGIFDLYEIIPGFLASLCCAIVFSLLKR